MLTALVHSSINLSNPEGTSHTENSELGLVVEETGHRHSLLLTSRQYIIPIVDTIKATLSVNQVSELHSLQVLLQILSKVLQIMAS